MSTSDDKTLVYGVGLTRLIFMPRQRALDIAQAYEAVDSSATWGELMNRLPSYMRDELVDFFEEAPDGSEAFERDDVPGLADGDWPGFPAQEMLEWMPRDIQQRFGKIETTVFNGDYLELDSSREQEIVVALEQNGFECIADQQLIGRAHDNS